MKKISAMEEISVLRNIASRVNLLTYGWSLMKILNWKYVELR